MDTIGDFLTIIRNASKAGKSICVASASNMRIHVADVLKKNGYIRDYSVNEIRPRVRQIDLLLKYVKGVAAITNICRCSRPGCRFYCASDGA